jgi:hypothetical protein
MDSKSGKSWLLGLGRGPAGQEGGFAVETNAKKIAHPALGVYSAAAGKAKWKSLPISVGRIGAR